MPAFKLAIFDFDGTLADSFPFFTRVFNELARKHGFSAVAAHEAESLRQLHPREIMRHVGMPALKLPLVAKDFIGLMRQHSRSITLFPRMPALLVLLARSGIEIGIVSSNAQDNVVAILGESASQVSRYACGSSIFGKRSHLAKLLRASATARSAALYIGDQASDLEAAHAERIAFGAVAWGYGTISHLERAGADFLFHSPDDIARLLLESTTPDMTAIDPADGP